MPQYARAQVIDSRGTAFATLGYTVRRQEYTEKRLELLPEEALYLVERGSMLCWKQTSNVPECPGDDEKDAIRLVGEPMSVQQCFMSMLGVEGITIEHYSVSATVLLENNNFLICLRCMHTSSGSDIQFGGHNPSRPRKNMLYTSTPNREPPP